MYSVSSLLAEGQISLSGGEGRVTQLSWPVDLAANWCATFSAGCFRGEDDTKASILGNTLLKVASVSIARNTTLCVREGDRSLSTLKCYQSLLFFVALVLV